MPSAVKMVSQVQQGLAGAPSAPLASSTVSSSEAVMASANRRSTENRRSNKPIMEKRRRARINNCLNELKTLILDAMKKDPARHSKLEKADILEMTVKHLQNLQNQQVAMSAAQDPSSITKFRAGFAECAAEVGKFPGIEPITKRRLIQHLTNCLNQSTTSSREPQNKVQVILPNPVEPLQQIPYLGNSDVQLVSTRLLSTNGGTIALVVPTSQNGMVSTNSPVPLLVPLPPRSGSTSSVGSSSSASHGPFTPPSSPELPKDYSYRHSSPQSQKPLSLVMRKEEVYDEKPWRPW